MEQSLMDALNNQVTAERQNEAVYIALANELDSSNLTGLARFMRKSASEESGHAAAFSEYLIDRGVRVVTDGLEGVSVVTVDMLQVGAACFEQALQLEADNTERINSLYVMADEVKDAQTCVFLHKFVAEQTRSVRELTELSAKLRFAMGCPAAVMQLDHELGEGER